MQGRTVARARAQHLGMLAVVLAAHGALLWSWRFIPPPAPRAPSAQQAPLTLRLIEAARWALPAPVAPAEPAPAERPRAPAAPATARATPPPPAVPVAPVAPPTPAEPAAISAAPPGAEPAAPIPPPIEFALPNAGNSGGPAAPRSLKEQMLNDPRSNSARPTLQSRVSAVAGSTQLQEQPMDATRMRVRQNGQCVEVHVARNAQLDPWNQNHSPTPRAVRPDC